MYLGHTMLHSLPTEKLGKFSMSVLAPLVTYLDIIYSLIFFLAKAYSHEVFIVYRLQGSQQMTRYNRFQFDLSHVQIVNKNKYFFKIRYTTLGIDLPCCSHYMESKTLSQTGLDHWTTVAFSPCCYRKRF